MGSGQCERFHTTPRKGAKDGAPEFLGLVKGGPPVEHFILNFFVHGQWVGVASCVALAVHARRLPELFA
jgi:hypothetical protein